MPSLDFNPNGYSEIPYVVYSDEELYVQEQSQVYRGRTWHFLALELELPNVGDFKTVFVGDTPVIVVRDKKEIIHAMVNRCAHRGNLVSVSYTHLTLPTIWSE